MNGKKARALRKSLKMTELNHRQKDYHEIKHDPKTVYFKDNFGRVTMKNVQRVTLINKNLYTYRKMKKDMTHGRK